MLGDCQRFPTLLVKTMRFGSESTQRNRSLRDLGFVFENLLVMISLHGGKRKGLFVHEFKRRAGWLAFLAHIVESALPTSIPRDGIMMNPEKLRWKNDET